MGGARHVYGVPVFLTGVRCDNGEQLIVASSEASDNAIEMVATNDIVERILTTKMSCTEKYGRKDPL